MKHIMVDIETLGTNSNSAVVSISAVAFDLESGKLGKQFEVGINILEQILYGGIIDNDTVQWWSTQSEEAKGSLVNLDTVSVKGALDAFNRWIADTISVDFKDAKLWGNGVGFDNVIIRNLYSRHDKHFVLPYWCDNDVRTLVTLGNINTRDFKFSGTKHNGIDDCKHQINYCAVAYKGL